MATANVGVVTPILKDEWDSTAAYDRLNIVKAANGWLYQAKQAVPAGTASHLLHGRKGSPRLPHDPAFLAGCGIGGGEQPPKRGVRAFSGFYTTHLFPGIHARGSGGDSL